MKRNIVLKKVLCLMFSSTFLLSLCACGKEGVHAASTLSSSPASSVTDAAKSGSPSDSGTSQGTGESSAYQNAVEAYNKFLSGTAEAQDAKKAISNGVVAIQDISLEPDLKTYYALFDMNGDGVPELHLRPVEGGKYVVFTYTDGQVVLWHDGPDYESPLNNGAILYERDGAAPTHINYYYSVLDSDGKEISRVEFSKYHSVDESSLSESADYDVFMIAEKEVSESEWNSLTSAYLSISSDLIVWNEL